MNTATTSAQPSRLEGFEEWTPEADEPAYSVEIETDEPEALTLF